MSTDRKLWIVLAVVLSLHAFGLLLYTIRNHF
jgi:hypothetical protein